MLTCVDSRQDPFDAAHAWFECDNRARLVVDTRLTISWINSAATRLIQDTKLFDIHGDTLRLSQHRWMSDFCDFVRFATETESMLCMPQLSDDHVLCTARDLNSGVTDRRIGLTFRYAARHVTVDGRALEQVFHLTFTERRVVEALFAGRTAEQVGVSFGVSVGTVRAHIRRIYEKLSVASREALFHKAMPFLAQF